MTSSPDPGPERSSIATTAGFVVAAVTVPASFQRTLVSRSTADQALVTSLTFVLAQTATSAIVSALEAGGRAVGDRTGAADPDRMAAAATAAGAAVGAALAIGVPRRERERLQRAAVRTGGSVTATAGVAGLVARAARRLAATVGIPGGSRTAAGIAAGTVAAARYVDVRRRALLDEGQAPDDTEMIAARALAMAAGVGIGSIAVSRLGGATARTLGRIAADVLPGDERRWRPLGHLLTFGVVASLGRLGGQRVFTGIEGAQTAFEAALDVPPPEPSVSGSPDSIVPYDTMSRMGRRLVWTVRPPDEIERVMGRPALAFPVRAYAGLTLADDREERVRLVLDDLERAGGLERSVLLVASPTGTGYVNYAAVGAMELMTLGDCATVAMQYGARPSPLSLDRIDEGREQFRLLVHRLGERLEGRASRPTVVVFGESLGAWTSQDAFLHRGTAGLQDAGVDRALWIGTPFESKWKDQVLLDDRDDVDPTTIGVFNDIAGWDRLDAATRDRIRYVMLTHHDDGVAHFGASLLLRRPDWLGAPEDRPPGVPRSQRWAPVTTFVQTLIDMKNAARVVPGEFAARGHDYRAALPAFMRAILDVPVSDDEMARITRALEAEEAVRTTWIAQRGQIGHGMANDLLARIRRDHPAAFDAAFHQLRTEVRGWRDAWDAGEPGTI